jgi:hypothetical protein
MKIVLRWLLGLYKNINKSRKAVYIFKTALSPAQILQAFEQEIKTREYFSFFDSGNEFQGNITPDGFRIRRIAGHNGQGVVANVVIFEDKEGCIISATMTSYFFYMKWLITLFLASVCIVVTYMTLRETSFSLFVLALYLLPMFAYIIPTRLFEFECEKAKVFIEKTFKAEAIT